MAVPFLLLQNALVTDPVSAMEEAHTDRKDDAGKVTRAWERTAVAGRMRKTDVKNIISLPGFRAFL